jgi:hypothetical protein
MQHTVEVVAGFLGFLVELLVDFDLQVSPGHLFHGVR